MKRTLRVEGEITDESRLMVELPPDAPRGSVVLTLEVEIAEEEPTDEDLRGLGLSAEEIAASAEIGAWADATEIESGASFVDELRLHIRNFRNFETSSSLSTPLFKEAYR